MSTTKRPDWAVEVNKWLWKMHIPKTKFAKMLGVNYTEMCNVLLGHRVHPTMQEKILEKLQELKNEK